MNDASDVAGIPLVTIAMPALNEARHIADAIRSVMPAPDAVACELLVMDGGSSDDTCAIVRALSAQDPRIRLIPNERRIQASGINLAARLAHPDSTYLVRADCHAAYPGNWVPDLIHAIRLREAVSVVVPLRTIGVTPLQRAIAAAQNSRLGNGGSAHRLGGISGYVSHGHHAIFDRREFLRVGGYDESFSHNEDAELDRRLCAAGGRIYLAADLAVSYFPRATLGSLTRQYFLYGRGCARTLEKHASLPRLRQMLPPLVLLYGIAALALATVAPGLLILLALYAGICGLSGLALALRSREPVLVMSGLAAIAMHLSWAAGFLSHRGYRKTLVRTALGRKPRFTSVSRGV
ncbi:glycosyltransferase family 2 protein [Methylobacterium sp. NEAU K]|uniref:glycosyltransferase family 2 protein n=1 Tax=Methylobacterium sp. NEAU K TaxID=3064946 RepID=UPI002736AA07|nr:glycosyltransferase family 2 protein [Methylobacterium sp. NEAU K]MDP4005844.1 glycosyltransferase family 2 protein [Methylobacterium sp. NEAU K]